MKVISLKKDSERRFKSGGHPWVFSNELSGSLKGATAGESAELRDAAGNFLARGFLNPHSLIAFRSVTRNPEVKDPSSEEFLEKQLISGAIALRERLGYAATSARLCFGEADGIPGLIVDRFQLTQSRGQIIVIQAHAAGVDRMLPILQKVLKKWAGPKSAIVIRNDVSVRKLEGIEIEAPRVELSGIEASLNRAEFDVSGQTFRADLLEGQKTGFFLDQTWNTIQVARMAQKFFQGQKEVRVLDLFSYVSQWGSRLSTSLKQSGVKNVHVTAMDASAEALEFAQKNLTHAGAVAEISKADILEKITQIPDSSYDLIVCDPPALIKSRKDHPAGKHAYLKLNTECLRILKKPGAIVSASCSAHFTPEDLIETLAKAARRSQVSPQWIFRGGHGPDHPVIAEFPEGQYLKTWFGVV